MSDAQPRDGAVPLCLRALAFTGALIAGLTASPASAGAQAPADATLCPPPPRRLSFAISAAAPTRKPARRKPTVARPKMPGAAPSARPVVRPRRTAGALPAAAAARPKKRAPRPRSVVPVPKAARTASVARATAVCKPWTHELAAPLVGVVASASTPTAWIPLVGASGSPFPETVADDSSSVGGWWWMLPAGGIAIAGATTGGGGGGEGGGVAGVEVGRGASGTPVVTSPGSPVEVPPTSIEAPDVPATETGTLPGDRAGPPGPTTNGPVFAPLPPVPPVGSTSPPAGSPLAPIGGTSDFTPAASPGDTPPGGAGPGRPGTGEPGPEGTPPQVATAVVPEPSSLSLVLLGGGLLTLVAWSAGRRV